jgi:hypothetical protein
MTFSMIINKMRHLAQQHSALWRSVVMLNVTYKPFMLSGVMLNVIESIGLGWPPELPRIFLFWVYTLVSPCYLTLSLLLS